jgi:CBS domain-containing protein
MTWTRKTIGEIVNGRPLYVVQADNSVLEAARYITDHQVGAAPVLSNGQLVGIISERDIVTRVVTQGLDPALVQVGQVMTTKLAVLDKDKTYCRALAVMDQLHIRHIPVMDGEQLIGCISIRELHTMDIEAKNAEIEFLDDYARKIESVL